MYIWRETRSMILSNINPVLSLSLSLAKSWNLNLDRKGSPIWKCIFPSPQLSWGWWAWSSGSWERFWGWGSLVGSIRSSYCSHPCTILFQGWPLFSTPQGPLNVVSTAPQYHKSHFKFWLQYLTEHDNMFWHKSKCVKAQMTFLFTSASSPRGESG